MLDYNSFQKLINYKFKKTPLLEGALTHSSVRQKNNLFERLEFLGDRVLGLVIADLLFKKFPDEKEGDLAKRSASLVRREACEYVAEKIKLKDFFNVADQESFINSSILSDAVEALLGAIYLDGGLKSCENFIQNYWEPLFLQNITPPKDSKSTLQEWAQSFNKTVPIYQLVNKEGSAHSPQFYISVQVEGYTPEIGIGSTKRYAEQAAAKLLLEKLSNA